ncbi:MAG: SH3 domain-containing protein [Ruminococcus sp.]|nr:SH3 domain-containing protein [Ruminococcus sp.]
MIKSYSSKIVAFALCFTVLLSTVVFAFCVSSFSADAASTDTLVTITDLNLRKSASTSASVLITIPKGKSVELLADSTSGWAKVKYSSYTGYCSASYLDLASSSTATISGKTTSELNLRSGKGTSYSVLTVIPNGKTVAVVDNSDEDWAKVTYSSKTGYVSKEYLTIIFKLGAVTPTEPSTPTEPVSPKPDYSNIPKWYSYSLTDSILSHDNEIYTSLMLNSKNIVVDTNGTFRLVAFVSGGAPVNEYISFESSDSSVAKVTDNGLVTGVKSGTAYITVTNLVTLKNVKCKVIYNTLGYLPHSTSGPAGHLLPGRRDCAFGAVNNNFPAHCKTLHFLLYYPQRKAGIQ